MIPSGYKTSKVYSAKPTTGSGDLDFTRSNDTATRVNSAGLIEKVRTNVLLQSNTFNTTWTTTDVTLASGQAGYDATNNAWSIVEGTVNTQHRIIQTVSGLSSGTPYTFSFYVKAIGNRNCRLRVIGTATTHDIFFNIQNGTIQTSTAGTGVISSVGSGWYRCSVAANIDLSTVSVYLNIADENFNTIYAGNNTSGILAQAAQVETGDIATNYIATTAAAVSVGPVANVPRLDYLNSSCPRLLLEPQRTNSVLWSEQFDNATWLKIGTTVTANNAVSPDGYTNADALVENTATSLHDTYQAFVSASSTAYTFSCYIKPSTRTRAYLRSDTSAGTVRTLFDLTGSGSVVTLTHTSASISLVGNGWYRCSITFTEGTGAAGRLVFVEGAVGTDINYAGNGLTAFWLYGAQLEAGAYATSYIPTLGAAVTRGADGASKTGISSLIGQTQGTIFVDFVYNGRGNASVDTFNLIIGTWASEAIAMGQFNDVFYTRIYSSSILQFDATFGSLTIGQRYKAAVAYASNDAVFYVNGSLIGSDSSVVVPATSTLSLIRGSFENSKLVNQALLFPTRLENDDLAALTSL
jgi:hypothetical protein